MDNNSMPNKEGEAQDARSDQPLAPQEFVCPITCDIMVDPVMSRYGQSYERSAIIEWLASGRNACPLTRQPLSLSGLVSNHKLKMQIRHWQMENECSFSLVVKSEEEDAFCAFMTIDDTTERTCGEEEDDSEEEPYVRETSVTVRRIRADEQEEQQQQPRRGLFGLRRSGNR